MNGISILIRIIRELASSLCWLPYDMSAVCSLRKSALPRTQPTTLMPRSCISRLRIRRESSILYVTQSMVLIIANDLLRVKCKPDFGHSLLTPAGPSHRRTLMDAEGVQALRTLRQKTLAGPEVGITCWVSC